MRVIRQSSMCCALATAVRIDSDRATPSTSVAAWREFNDRLLACYANFMTTARYLVVNTCGQLVAPAPGEGEYGIQIILIIMHTAPFEGKPVRRGDSLLGSNATKKCQTSRRILLIHYARQQDR